MSINELHASHIKKVVVGFVLSGEHLNPNIVSEVLGLLPDYAASKGDESHNNKGNVIGIHSEGVWRIDTENKVQSKDINEHFQYLLSLLLPHKTMILKFAEGGETFFDVLWQSTYLYAGTGPVISNHCLQGMS